MGVQMMNSSKLKLLSIFCLVILFPITGAIAQTCRIKAGRSTGKCKEYLEVFEYDYVSEKPLFPGGDAELIAFINKTREYPAEAYKKGIQGRVTCAFVVNTDGSVSHISILRGVDPALNQEAIRIFSKMPEWKPGKLDGHTVPVRVIWSVPFRK